MWTDIKKKRGERKTFAAVFPLNPPSIPLHGGVKTFSNRNVKIISIPPSLLLLSTIDGHGKALATIQKQWSSLPLTCLRYDFFFFVLFVQNLCHVFRSATILLFKYKKKFHARKGKKKGREYTPYPSLTPLFSLSHILTR